MTGQMVSAYGKIKRYPTTITVIFSSLIGVLSAVAPFVVQASGVDIASDIVSNTSLVSALAAAIMSVVAFTVVNIRISLRRRSSDSDAKRSWATIAAIRAWGSARNEA